MQERDGGEGEYGVGMEEGVWGVEGECERRVDRERNNYTN